MGEPVGLNIGCMDFDAALDFYTRELGFRLDMITPADAPRLAALSGHGITLRLCAEPVARQSGRTGWAKGRAGMEYRDLIPDRCGGRYIASHIRIPNGGPVPDYVHYHKVRFQMIYCRRGWVRAVYEDQGPPFVMNEGDCVLQPPEIRHRVLESSAGLEVVEISCPAEHETWRDHALQLPTANLRPARDFSGHQFVRHIASDARWQREPDGVFESRDTGIAEATRGLAGARVLRLPPQRQPAPRTHTGEFLFYFLLTGEVRLHGPSIGERTLVPDDPCHIPAGTTHTLTAVAPSELLEVLLPPA